MPDARSGKRKGDGNEEAPHPSKSLKTSRSNNRASSAKKKKSRDDYRAAAANADTEMPRKKFYRQRAHANPFSDHQLSYPVSPQEMDWSTHYPAFVDAQSVSFLTNSVGPPRMKKQVEVADIGCGFGGLLTALAPRMPDTLILGMEIRVSVTEYVVNKIRVLRQQQKQLRESQPPSNEKNVQISPAAEAAAEATAGPSAMQSTISLAAPKPKHHEPTRSDPIDAEASAENGTEALSLDSSTTNTSNTPIPGSYQNISALRTNTMKFLTNHFTRSQLHSIYLLFPDPHFKARKHKARIVSSTLCSEYAYVLRPGGVVYTITDVEDLHLWMAGCFDKHPAFERVWEEELREKGDIGVSVVWGETEEGKKVERVGGKKYAAFWRRREDPPWPGEEGIEGLGNDQARRVEHR